VEHTVKILVVAGEASGDRLAARALEQAAAIAASQNTTLDLFGIGGRECQALGMKCFYSTDQMSVVGFLEVAKRYFFFRNVLKNIISVLDSKDKRPNILFLIDYPGFNLRLAKEARKRGIRVVFYVSPQVWAWKASRVKDIVASVNHMLVIFPFEVEIYTKAGLKNTCFVGHPLLEIIEQERITFISRQEFAEKFKLDAHKNWLVFFPGSRKEEVTRHLEVMSKAALGFCSGKNWQPVIVESESVPVSSYDTNSDPPIKRFRSAKDVHQLMYHAQLGILKSGTTTLEATLMGLLGVICYKTSALTYLIAKRMITVKFIGLANIVLGKKLYPELIQSEFTPERIKENLEFVYKQKEIFTTGLKEVWNILQSPNDSPSRRVAEILLANA
jgi:lipid-A-disaccharide synthase